MASGYTLVRARQEFGPVQRKFTGSCALQHPIEMSTVLRRRSRARASFERIGAAVGHDR